MITKLLTHSVTSFGLLKNSQLFQIPDFLVESILKVYRHFPWCMSGRLCIWFELEFVWHSWKLPYSGKNIRVDIKDVPASSMDHLEVGSLRLTAC